MLVGIAPGAPERPQLVKGFMQLYSVEQSRSQALEAHAAAFTTLQLGGKSAPVISFAQKTLAGGAVVSKLHVIELGQPGQTSLMKSAELFFPPEFADDFPVSMQIRWGRARRVRQGACCAWPVPRGLAVQGGMASIQESACMAAAMHENTRSASWQAAAGPACPDGRPSQGCTPNCGDVAARPASGAASTALELPLPIGWPRPAPLPAATSTAWCT